MDTNRELLKSYSRELIRIWTAIVLLVAALPATAGFAQTYSTNFEGEENPLSENGKWVNNSLDWCKVRKGGGIAYGTQTGVKTGPARFDDSFAHLAGFPPNQEAWGEVRVTKPDPTCNQEVEILLRWTSSEHSTTGYECFGKCAIGKGSWLQIVRWDGPLGKYTTLVDKRGPDVGLKDGDILKASIVGNVITLYVNGVERAQASDDTFKTGNPGIGIYLECSRGHGVGTNAEYGLKNFTARAIGPSNTTKPKPETTPPVKP